MKTYTYSEARQRLASVLDQAGREGRVQIRRQDGSTFVLQPVVPTRSPLDVPANRAASGDRIVEALSTPRRPPMGPRDGAWNWREAPRAVGL